MENQTRAQPPPKTRALGKYAHLPRKEALRLILRDIQFRLGRSLLAANKGVMHFRQ